MAKEILIADSDKSDQKEFQRIFETTDYHLIFSESGEDALLRAKLFKPDMIIASGAGLQEKGGLELCGAVKGDPDFKYTPFILISGVFDEISEKDRKRLQADGVISKPLNEVEVLELVSTLMGEGADGKRGETVPEKQEFSLDETGEEEEEIIELVDVVEEPEPRMSIDSFVPTGREKTFVDATSMDGWEKPQFDEEKPLDKEPKPRPGKKIPAMDLRLKEKVPLKEASPEEELFDKIELEEILEKVEQLKPTLEKEWPAGKEVRDIDESPFQIEEPSDKLDLSGFEKALRREVKTGPPQEEAQPFFPEEPKKKIEEESIFEELVEKPLEEPLEKMMEAPEEPLEETVEKPLEASMEEAIEEALEKPAEETVEEPAEMAEIEEVSEEEFPEELLDDLLEEKEVKTLGEPREEEAEDLDLDLDLEELKLEEIEEIEELEKMEGMEEVRKGGGMAQTDQIEEMEPLEEIDEIEMDRLEEVGTPGGIQAETPKTTQGEAPEIPLEEAPSLVRAVDKHMEELISQKVQEIMGEMMTKLVPEMTRNVVGFTLERIEKMVKEVVPDLAEKAIQEEIKRLEKGEKRDRED